MKAAAKKATPKIPKNLPAAVDRLWSAKEERLAISRTTEVFSEEESALKAHIISELGKTKATGIAGKLARVELVGKTVPTVIDWDVFYAYVKKTGSFELLSRSMNVAAVTERWDAGKTVPGVESTTFSTLSLKKV
jgi:hypothetical protein